VLSFQPITMMFRVAGSLGRPCRLLFTLRCGSSEAWAAFTCTKLISAPGGPDRVIAVTTFGISTHIIGKRRLRVLGSYKLVFANRPELLKAVELEVAI